MHDTLIECKELNERLPDPDWVVIDCRYDLADTGAGYRAYLQGHIPQAVYSHLHDDLSGPPVTDCGRHPLPAARQLEELFSSYGIDGRTQVIVYDDSSGSIAARLWWMLRYMGHESAAVLNGGWRAWLAAGFEIDEQENKRPPRVFQGRPRREWLVTVSEVPSVPRLIDSREPARFRGEHEPIDPVAGHIPGAHNYFWKDNLDAEGCYRSPAEIRRRLEEAYCDTPAESVTFYCGSGVTACANVLAAVHAGLPFPRLYAGSWSEWCSDSSRPVATGSA